MIPATARATASSKEAMAPTLNRGTFSTGSAPRAVFQADAFADLAVADLALS